MWRTISYRVFRAERGAERRARTESLGRAEDEQFLCDATLARWLRRSALLHTLIRGSFGKVYIVRFSYPSFELARWRNSVHSASRVTLVRVYAGHAAGRDLGAAAAMLI